MNRLKQMSIFAHIVEEGSVSAAALKLDLSKSVVSQHLKILEQELGLTLIKRTTRRQALTATGEVFYQNCKEINSIANSAWEQAQESQVEPKGRIRITAPNALMEILVTPVVAELMRRYPKLKPELISDDQALNLMKHDVDLAIRVGSSQDSNLKQKRIGEFRDVFCGIPDIKLDDIDKEPYIANHWQGKFVRHKFKSKTGKTMIYEKEADCIANSFHSCLALIRSGAGIGIIPDFYFSQIEPEVVSLLPDMMLPKNPVYALNPFNKNTPLAVQLCITALEERLRSGV
ncbi:TPA: LysR family transcriptional regulator [Vibrio diabolicus]|uniref:Transcriptional regulator n=2 Tax=Vibrio diabolicus TaxID=50719 RepID=A0AAX1XSY4_9VIBR|nr:LysR family transcriptional regulator [Vibrio diabolicus]MCR9608671.1 LysR family transcriptional regulator [Vibrio alginolyticus]MCR9614365.1 LysR family transcriptional regulator [Vibrio alginolyticus]MCS0347180.1 LysR family transcriptional regulator [Vibrio diabolicus]MCS0359284.1 LysR family transcriptional regulator [Vibrio diabolicus]MCS0373835.1 LysR family transcriptional regulator [Vibrio diabolicus]